MKKALKINALKKGETRFRYVPPTPKFTQIHQLVWNVVCTDRWREETAS